jgi:hypothetical protein
MASPTSPKPVQFEYHHTHRGVVHDAWPTEQQTIVLNFANAQK